MSLKCIDFLNVIKSIIVNDCFVICVGSSLLSKTVDVTHPSQDQPIKPIQQQDPTEDTTTPAAPTEVEGPPSSRLRSKTKQQHTSPKQEQPERNPTPMDPPERNPAEIEVNSIDIIPETYSWMRLTKLLSYAGKTIADPTPVSLP